MINLLQAMVAYVEGKNLWDKLLVKAIMVSTRLLQHFPFMILVVEKFIQTRSVSINSIILMVDKNNRAT